MATYTVKKGDTLSAIAKKYGTTYQEIAKANGISNPNKINVGQVLTIGNNANHATPKTTTPTTPTASNLTNGFTYNPYEKSDVVKQAESMLEQHKANKPGEYQSNWQTQLNEALEKILNREEYSYDLNGDALYQQYKDYAMLQGSMASMDVMGQAAAMNGGYGSSFAQTVGHQAYQGHLQKLNDIVPELYQLALARHNQETQDILDQYAILADKETQDYDRHRNFVSDYNAELARLIENARYEGATDYGRYMDKVNMDYAMHRDTVEDATDEKSQASELALSILSLGTMPSAELLASAGISSADARAIVEQVKKNETIVNSFASNTPEQEVDNGGPPSTAVTSFMEKIDKYTKHWGAVERDMWGSPKTYIAQQIEESNLTDSEKAYLVSKYGITESDLNYKNK